MINKAPWVTKIKWEVTATLNVAIYFTEVPLTLLHIDAFVPAFNKFTKFGPRRNQALAFASNRQKPFPLPHCRGLQNLPRVVSVVQTYDLLWGMIWSAMGHELICYGAWTDLLWGMIWSAMGHDLICYGAWSDLLWAMIFQHNNANPHTQHNGHNSCCTCFTAIFWNIDPTVMIAEATSGMLLIPQ